MTVLVSLGWTVLGLLNDHLVARNDSDLACHHGGNEGTSAIANAPAGSKITFQWTYVSRFLNDLDLSRNFRVHILLSGLEVRKDIKLYSGIGCPQI